MSTVDFKKLSKQQYFELEHQMETTPDPNTTYTGWGAHPHLEELLRKYGYPPAGRYEAFQWGVMFLEMGYDEDTTSDDGSISAIGEHDAVGGSSEPLRMFLEHGVSLQPTGATLPVRVQERDEIRRMGYGEQTTQYDAEGLIMNIPDFLKIGSPIWCGFAGWIEDIAIGQDTIMVKVESPKRRLLNRGDEWLPYKEGIMRPLTNDDFLTDVGVYSTRKDEMVKNFYDAVEKLNNIMASGV